MLERLRIMWAEWAPAREGRRRFSVARVVIMTRAEVHELAWQHMELGARLEREHPGTVAEAKRRMQEDEQGSKVRHLHAV